VRERFDADGFVKVRDLRFTTESLSAVDEEGVGATDRLSTGVSERERRIVLVAGVDQRIQDSQSLLKRDMKLVEAGFLFGFNVRIVPEYLQLDVIVRYFPALRFRNLALLIRFLRLPLLLWRAFGDHLAGRDFLVAILWGRFRHFLTHCFHLVTNGDGSRPIDGDRPITVWDTTPWHNQIAPKIFKRGDIRTPPAAAVGDGPRWTTDATTTVGLPVDSWITMRVEFDRDTCAGFFNCVAEWEAFIEDRSAGKATLVNSDETAPDMYVREVPNDEELDAKMAAQVCPVDAITIYDDSGTQLVP